MKNVTIGWFGDSFVASRYSTRDREVTFLKLVENYLNVEKDGHLGLGGSSLEDCIILQFMPLFESNALPDICIFSWTDIHRLYNKKIRGFLNGIGTIENALKNMTDQEEQNILKAAKYYYLYLLDPVLDTYRATALLEWFDNNILSKLKDKKIIHLWSFGKEFNKTINHYRWKNGVEIRPSLNTVSNLSSSTTNWGFKKNGERIDARPNHISYEYNQIPFEWIKTAIDNYQNGLLYDYTDQINKMKEENRVKSAI